MKGALSALDEGKDVEMENINFPFEWFGSCADDKYDSR